MVVDDEQDIIDLITLFAKKHVAKISSATNGAMALDVIRKEKIDLIFSDISMPEMNGEEFVKSLREFDQNTYFVFISAYVGRKEAILGSPYQVYDFMTKPVGRKTIDDFFAKLKAEKGF